MIKKGTREDVELDIKDRFAVKELKQLIKGRKKILKRSSSFYGVAFTFSAVMLGGAALGIITVPVQVQVLLAGSVIAEIVSIHFFIVKYYFPPPPAE